MLKRTYEFTGIIQGVGFRPCVSRLARELSVAGWIQNRSGCVRAEFVASADKIDALLLSLQNDPPPLSSIESISLISELQADDQPHGFRILEGISEDSRNIMIPADIAMCHDCLRELTDPGDRRYQYPFTTCVNCGPRYTVITGMPYERKSTTMHKFPLCSKCSEEYGDPDNRRFHAETTCCPVCGPQLSLLETGNTKQRWVSASLTKPDAAGTSASTQTPAALAAARKALHEGRIVAVKGIGGFLLAIDPGHTEAVTALRQRKNRPHKPLAVMARSINTVRKAFRPSKEEEKLLLSPQAPIVILDTAGCANPGFDLKAMSPDTDTLGVMLPTSPLHMLLFEQGISDKTPPFDFLVMTSGNLRSEPICLTTAEAIERLTDIADVILTHDRDIALRNDDSLCIVHETGPQVWRRARGFAPASVRLHAPLSRTTLAMGAEIKSTLAIGYDSEVVISPHIGDLETPEAIEHMNVVADALPAFLGKDIEAVAVDLNPDMHSSVAGRRMAERLGTPLIEVQHHEAHAYACLAENGQDTGFALTFDGTGLGRDNTIWGAELFHIDHNTCIRVATFKPAPLPGGDKAVKNPARQLIARLLQCGVTPSPDTLSAVSVTQEECSVWQQQYAQDLNCPVSSGAGRLFDAMAVVTGCAPNTTTYEGQPAIRLEALARRHTGTSALDILFQSDEHDKILEIDWSPFFRTIKDIRAIRQSASEYAMAFHSAVINSAVTMLEYGFTRYPTRTVALSGGVMMNRIIHNGLTERLKTMKIKPLTHSHTPPNDGCISLGQVIRASTQ